MGFKSILAGIGNAIANFFTTAPQEVDDAFTKAEGFVNVIKSIEGSIPGQLLESLVNLVFPGTGTAIFIALNGVLNDFGIVGTAVTGVASDISAAGLTAINKLQGDSKTLALSNVASIIGHTASNANGGGSTLQQAIVALPVIHNPGTLGAVTPVPNLQPPVAA